MDIKRAAKIAKYSKINKETANYMLENHLVMRNSNTKQLISRHYGKDIYPESHGIGVDYCVPLWTIAIKDLHDQPIKQDKRIGDQDKIKKKLEEYEAQRQKEYFEQASKGKRPSTLPFSESFSKASEQQLEEHFSDYIDRIKSFIHGFGPLSTYTPDETHFDYELLIAADDTLQLDDLGRYSTGGRAHGNFNSKTIKYRVTLNEFEINFIKSLLRGEKDELIPGIEKSKNIPLKYPQGATVEDSLRRLVSEQLAIEIITAKLISWLNCLGKNKGVISLDKFDLELLLARSVTIKKNDIDEYITNGTQRVAYKDPDYLQATKNDDRKFTLQFKKALKTEQDKTWYYSLFGKSVWSAKPPANIREILTHALNDRTILGYRNRSFEICRLLGWLDDKGQLTEKFKRNVTMNEAYNAIPSAPSANTM